MRLVVVIIFLWVFSVSAYPQNYQPVIEPGPCSIKAAEGLMLQCGLLVVPENRKKVRGRTVKLPFVYVRKSGTDAAKNVMLYTGGGPGYSSLPRFDSIRTNFEMLQFGGYIWFNQRGTYGSQPCLECPEVKEAARQAYLKNLSQDSLRLEAVKRCRQRLLEQNVDLSAYNTIESAADINDLRKALGIDSLTLFGISYSGGLMLTVARNHPEGVRAMILNAPLPGFVNYEERALLNHEEALEVVFNNAATDSTHDTRYAGLKKRFRQYFQSITGKKFRLRYRDSLDIDYSKQELMDAIIDRVNTFQLKMVPWVIHEIIEGNHTKYVKEALDGIFSGSSGLAHGMRYSVYCAEQIAYADRKLERQQQQLFPWYTGYAFNNVDHNICDCWKVKAGPPISKTPVYANIPTLIAIGDADPWCRPYYTRLIQKALPNSQLLIVRNNGHGARLAVKGIDFLKMFMDHPFQKIVSSIPEVVVE